MQRKRILLLAVAVSAALLVPGARPAGAMPLLLDDCDSFGCEGSSLSLAVTEKMDGSFDVELGIDTAGYTGSRTLITSASFKAVSGISAADLTLVGTPGGSWSDPLENNINNADCSGQGNDFACTQGSVEIGALTAPGLWSFHVAQGSLLPMSDWHIGFKYGEGDGKIISATAPVPEPSAALAFALGGLLVGATVRRRAR